MSEKSELFVQEKHSFEFALGELSCRIVILDPEKMSNDDDLKAYKKAANDLFDNIRVLTNISSKYPELVEKARAEVDAVKLR